VLDALPRALRLDDTERALLRALARPPRIPFVAPDAGATTTEVRPSVGMLIDGLDQPAAHTATPDVDSLGTDLGDRYGSGRGTSGTVKAPIDEETKPAQ
jgi:hypothetical protein